MNPTFWRKKRTLVAGHTGFKGAWLTLWPARLEAYAGDAERGVSPTDSVLGLRWPLEIDELAVKDAQHPLINDEFEGLVL